MRDDHQARARADLASNEQARFILAQIAKRFELSTEQLLGRDRQWPICWPRFIAITLIHESTKAKQWEIGQLFGIKQQSVWNALRSVQDLLDTSALARSDVDISRTWCRLPQPRSQNAQSERGPI